MAKDNGEDEDSRRLRRAREKQSSAQAAGRRRRARSQEAKATAAQAEVQCQTTSGRKTSDEGLRSYAKYRDLGMRQGHRRPAQAHVIRLIPPCDPRGGLEAPLSRRDLQMIYVLKGWIKRNSRGKAK